MDKKYSYIGNGAYCYANSTAMLLAANGENIPPSLIEVLSGVGLGAFISEEGLPFFSGLTAEPDAGITRALNILGYDFKEEFSASPNNPPFKKLKQTLKKSPALLGPLDMGFLTYNPEHKHLLGVDHYILTYGVDDKFAYLHDPAEFPHIRMPLKDLTKAWRADNIGYKRGHYRWWTNPIRKKKPTKKQIYQNAIVSFRSLYLAAEKDGKLAKVPIDDEAIKFLAGQATLKKLSSDIVGFMASFSFPLGAKRANDFTLFFEPHNTKLSELKYQQSRLFGLCHSLLMVNDLTGLGKELNNLAKTEKKFKETLLG
jgi:hypothetical protein